MDRILSLAPDMVNLDNPHVWKELLQRRQRSASGKTLNA